MNQYFMIKKHIDEMDYLNLLANHAPDDEFDTESKEISTKVTDSSTIQEIAFIIAEVFNKQFSDNNSPNIFMDCAEKIYNDIHTLSN